MPSLKAKARQRLRGRDESDWPILATALDWHVQCGPKMRIFFGYWHRGVDYKSNRDFS